MYIKNITFTNFRCFSHRTFTIEKPYILIEGLNGSGKTSFLEGLYYLAYGKSFRTAWSRECIAQNTLACSVDVRGITDNEDWHIYAARNKEKKIVRLNEKTAKTMYDILPFFHPISLTAQDYALIEAFPQERRSLIDGMICALYPGEKEHFVTYKKTLLQRNALLKKYHASYLQSPPDGLYAIWSEKLTLSGNRIKALRYAMITLLNETVTQIYHQAHLNLLNKNLTLVYREKNLPDYGDTAIFGREVHAARTLYGPHVDSIEFLYHNQDARIFASRGQQKYSIFLCKMACARLLGEKTIFLIDDFFIDFDPQITQMLLSYITSMGIQTFITAPGHMKALILPLLTNADIQEISF